jgi:hypothetical protein
MHMSKTDFKGADDRSRGDVCWWSLVSYLLLQTAFGVAKLSICPGMTIRVLLLPTFLMWVYAALLTLWRWVTLDLDFTFNNEDLEES